MNVIIKKGKLKGSINAIPSKSYFHRAIIASAISDYNAKIVADTSYLSDDVLASLSCVKALGAKVKVEDNLVLVDKIKKNNSVVTLDAKESGSTLRFLIPISLALYDKVIFKATKRLIDRGIEGYNDVFKKNNTKVEYNGDSIILSGKIKDDDYVIDGSKSSQYVSGMLFLMAYFKSKHTLSLKSSLASSPYVDITIDVLNKFGTKINFINNTFKVEDTTIPTLEYVVEGDYSNAAFIDAFNYFNSNVKINNLNKDSYQGDKVYQVLFPLLSDKNTTIDISNCIDLGPVLFTFASLKHGATFTGCQRLKIKESNRVEDLLQELAKIGVKSQVLDDGDKVIINKTDISKYQDITFDSHNDHRLVMALSLVLSMTGGKVLNANAVNKSYPKFFEDLKYLGLDIEKENIC